MNKKGYTLVEMMVVVGILGIVLMIAIPQSIKIMEINRDRAYNEQIEMIKDAANNYIVKNDDLVWQTSKDTRTLSLTLNELIDLGYISEDLLDPRSKDDKAINCALITVTRDKNDVYSYNVDTTNCSNVISSSPKLTENLIPIKYDGSNWIKASYKNKNNTWYDYDNKNWANAVTVSSTTRNKYKSASVGTVISESDINAMYVWIPRFKYKLFNNNGLINPTDNGYLKSRVSTSLKIDVKIDNTRENTIGNDNGEWTTHSAFTFGGKQISGFWVGKFELSSSSNNVVVKPNVSSLRSTNISTFNSLIRAMDDENNIYGLDSSFDSHVIKNIEWGALTYLTYSKYGKNTEVTINSNSSYLTGAGNYKSNINESTTGNITGVYDTVGGASEYTLGVEVSNEDSTKLNVTNSGFSQETLDNLNQTGYVDSYEYSLSNEDISRGHLGDATLEMGPINNNISSWYGDQAKFIYGNNSFFIRGGDISSSSASGSSAFDAADGGGLINVSSRVIIL